MKKNLFIAVLLIFILTACLLTACSVTTCKDGHKWVKGDITKEATCEDAGEMIQKCSVCDATQPIAISPLGHKYGNWTANEDGLTHSRVCETDPSHIDTANHSDKDDDMLCDGCGFEMAPPACEHVWGEWTDNGDGTCSRVCTLDSTHTESGDHVDVNADEICDNCGRNDHICQWGEYTYNEDGTHTRVCTLNADHNETANCSGGTATCEEAGRCEICDGAYIPATDHNYPETWTDNGANHIKVCENGCGIDLTEDHAHTETGRTPAGCEVAEVITYSCVCGNSYTSDGQSALGHSVVEKYVVEDGKLFWTSSCSNSCECNYDDIKTEITGVADVANEEDLKTVLENGFDAKLTADITLVDGPVEITAYSNSLDLNGHNLTSTGIKQSPTTGLMVCDVFIVKNGGVRFDITGDGVVSAVPSAEALEGIDESDLSVCIISALDGAYVTIEGGTYTTNGSTIAFARTMGRIDIVGGHFTACEDYDGVNYTFDIVESELNEYLEYGTINIIAGEFVGYNPNPADDDPRYNGDAGYRAKLVEFYSHVTYDATTDTYTVAHHNYAETEEGAHCADCGATVWLPSLFVDGDVIYLADVSKDELFGNAMILTLEAVEGTVDQFYVYWSYIDKYIAMDGTSPSDGSVNIIFVDEKADNAKFIVRNNGSDAVPGIVILTPDEVDTGFEASALCLYYCNNHDPQETYNVGCEDNGSYTMTCENCGMNRVIVTPPIGHAYLEYRTPATCEDPEIIVYSCDNGCGSSYTEIGQPALGHDWVYTDRGDGTHDMVCQNNKNHTQNEVCNPKGEYVTTVPATCTTGAYTRYECDLCSGVTTSSEWSEPLGHDYTWVDNGDGTCTGTCSRDCEEGNVVTQDHVDADVNCVCDNCGAEVHKYEVTEKVDPTHQVDGYAIYTCASCSDTYREELGKLIDCVEIWVDLGDGTCKSACIVEECAYPYEGPYEHIDEDGDCLCDRGCGAEVHTITRIVEIVEPTCMAEGYTLYACANCNQATEKRDFTGRVLCFAAYEDNGDGTCTEVCGYGCAKYPSEHPQPHVDSNADDICDLCEHQHIWDEWTANDGEEIGCLRQCTVGECNIKQIRDHIDENRDEICENCGGEYSFADQRVEEEIYVDFENVIDRVELSSERQVWKENGVVVTVDRGASTTTIYEYTGALRLAQDQVLTIDCTGMTSITFGCDVNSQAIVLRDSISANSNYTVKVKNETTIVTFVEEADSIVITLSGTTQVDSISIVAMRCPGEHFNSDDDEICDVCGADLHVHNYVPNVVAPNCTWPGYTIDVCSCGKKSEKYDTVSMDENVHNYTVWLDNQDWRTHVLACEYNTMHFADPVVIEQHIDEDQDGVCDVCNGQYPISVQSVEKEFTLTFDDKVKRTEFSTEKQVWEENGIKLINNKASSTNSVADYSAPARFYKSSQIVIDCVGMTKIVFDCNKTSYVTVLSASISENANYSVTSDSDKVIVTFVSKVDTLEITLTGAVWLDSITVTALRCPGDHGDEDKNEICDYCDVDLHVHDYTSTTTAPTCTEAGYTTYTCACGDSYTENGDSATGHSYQYADSNGRCLETCANCDHSKEMTHVDDNADSVCDKCETAVTEEDTQKQEVILTLTFDDVAKRTSFSTQEQVWEENGIKLTNNKAGSSNDIGNYSAPARFYKSSQIEIECAGMKQIVFDCNTAAYATALVNSITADNCTVSVSSDKVTVVFTEEVDSFTIESLSAQVRMDGLTVTAMQ